MKSEPHILIVDDNREILDLVSRFLVKEGYRTSTALDGRAMRKILKDAKIDLVILDLMLPGEDGLSLCRGLRAQSNIAIIMLTAMGEETDRIIGLEMGADDYLAKPFNPRELLARIKAVLRRFDTLPTLLSPPEDEASLHSFAGWTLNIQARMLANPKGEAVDISGGEFELLQVFVTHPGRVLNRDQLLDMARGRDAQPFDRSIDVQVSRLRKKIEPDPKKPELIKTVRGGGYMLTATVSGNEAPDT